MPFDSIKVGTKDSDKIVLDGTIQNNRKNKPVLIGDGLRVTGDVDASSIRSRGSLNVAGTTSIGALNILGWITTPGDSIVGVDDDLRVKKNLYIDGSATLAGATTVKDINVTGALTAGQYNVGQIIIDTATLAGRHGHFLDCVGTFAEIWDDVRADDWIFCHNTWLAGHPMTVLSNSTLSPAQTAQIEARREFDTKDPAQVVHEMAAGN